MSDAVSKQPRNELSSFAVLGTGALGGLYGGLLAHDGNSVHFLVRSDFDHIRDHGLKIESPLGDFALAAPQIYAQPADLPQVDVVIVAWKTTSNAALKQALEQTCHPRTIVLVLQNGLDVEKDAAAIVGDENVLGGCCFLCSNKVGPGHIRHLDYGTIVFGEYAAELRGAVSDRMRKLEAIFQRAGIDLRPTENLQQARWKKLVWNIPFNGLSVVLNANTEEIMQDPQARLLAEQLMVEVRRAAKANGINIEASHIEHMLEATRKMVPYDSSMSLDFVAKRPIEVESIFGNPLRASHAAGYQPEKIEMLYEQLCCLDRRNRRV
ncbi:MAG: putative 2-dehydropantoate 2-reductase [bacterium]|nr:putative 2-dehydropantoate 2-reductase [bacterium]